MVCNSVGRDLPGVQGALHSIPNTASTGCTHGYARYTIPCTWEVETRGSGDLGYSQLHNEFKIRHGFIEPYL